MDAHHFDGLARRLGTRRTALGGLLAGLLLPLEASARGKGKTKKHKGHDKDKRSDQKAKGKGKGKGQDQHGGATAQTESCWRAGACIPKKGANVSLCNLAGYTAPDNLNCTGCNLSRANLRGAELRGANFTKANLSGACLVDADFTGAIFATNTNLANAIFCRTIMPDGSLNDSVCESGTACCPTACEPTCAGKACGAADGCGGACQTGSCPGGDEFCDAGRCLAPGTFFDCQCFGDIFGSVCTQEPCGNVISMVTVCAQFCAARGSARQAIACGGVACTICRPQCAGKACGAGDGCGGACQAGSCPGDEVCDAGRCRPLQPGTLFDCLCFEDVSGSVCTGEPCGNPVSMAVVCSQFCAGRGVAQRGAACGGIACMY